MIGISAGAITIRVLNINQKQELISFLDSFFKILNQDYIDSGILLKHSILNNLQTLITMWLLGIIVIGIPIIMGVVILRGFVIGFTVGFLVSELGFKGFLFAILAILPQNLFIIPGIIIISVVSINFSIMILRNKLSKNNRYRFSKELINYTVTILILSSIIIIGSLVEAYITPVFMKLISGYVA